MLVSSVFLFSHELSVNDKHVPAQIFRQMALNLGLH